MSDPIDDPIAVSPAEPPELRALGETSAFPESVGLDFCWLCPSGIAGVQRKQFPDDLLASLSDGRLQKEIMQIDSSVAIPLLLLEGRGAGWTIDGRLICGYQRFTRQQMNGILFSLQIEHGIASIWVDSMAQTGPAIMDFRKWTQKHSHKSLTARPGPGTHMKRPWQEHFLQGLPAVGPKTASKIMDHFGRLPFTPPTVDELAQIDGIGKRKAQAIVGMFE